jgi:hypothetical protein
MPTNVNFLANFIARNPGCTPVQARRALCAFNGKKYHRGYYTDYTSGIKYVGPRAQYPYWVNFEGGLYITELGLTKRV